MVGTDMAQGLGVDERMFSGGPMIRGHVEFIRTVQSRREIRVWCDCPVGEDHAFARPVQRPPGATRS